MNSRFFLVLILVFCLAGLALAQTDTARLIGTITDSTGAVIPNAYRRGNRHRNRADGDAPRRAGRASTSSMPCLSGKYHIEVKQDRLQDCDCRLYPGSFPSPGNQPQAGNWRCLHNRGRDRRSSARRYSHLEYRGGDPGTPSSRTAVERPQLHALALLTPGRHPRRLWRYRSRQRYLAGRHGRDLAQLRYRRRMHWSVNGLRPQANNYHPRRRGQQRVVGELHRVLPTCRGYPGVSRQHLGRPG